MFREPVVKTKALGGTSELTVIATLRPGLVPSLETATYRTRAKRLLEALDLARSLSHEYAWQRYFSDAVERVGLIHAVRITTVDDDRLMLSVIFDGSADSYMRVLWQKVGTLLDVIFCNTVDYPLAWNSSFETWAGWVRRHQIETDYLYATPRATVGDGRYLGAAEALRASTGVAPSDPLAGLRLSMPSVESETWRLLERPGPDLFSEFGRQGLSALALLYRLASLYLPSDPDGKVLEDGAVLQRAARDLLREFVRMLDEGQLEEAIELAGPRVAEPVAWLRRRPESVFCPRPAAPPLPAARPPLDPPRDVQAGIVDAYANIGSGSLLLLAVTERSAAGLALEQLVRRTSWASAAEDNADGAAAELRCNLALSFDGLRALGMSEERLELFPLDFRQGMAARASLLGDAHGNHPQRWSRPELHGPAANDGQRQVELSRVHLVVQFRSAAAPLIVDGRVVLNPPLQQAVDETAALPGLELLHVQPLLRLTDPAGNVQEHFGYLDGGSDPSFAPLSGDAVYRGNQLPLGEFLLGYPTVAEAPPVAGRLAGDPAARHAGWLKNGSYLVIRKLAQDVGGLRAAVAEAVAAHPGIDAEVVYAKLMGRSRDGTALAAAAPGNDFDYAGDAEGRRCPLHAHIRRANPRLSYGPVDRPVAAGARPPRLLRRGMSFGPRYDDAADAARGLVFMAYVSSIAEQFEAIQRWISGGNSTGGYSGQADPLCGVPPPTGRRAFGFEHDGREVRLRLDGTPSAAPDAPLPAPAPFVRLDWGLYLLAPSRHALLELARGARTAKPFERPWSVVDGIDRIQAIQARTATADAASAVDAWKVALEDLEAQRDFRAASIWAAVRGHFGGVLRTPYGVLVADRAKVAEVLANAAGRYSVSGYASAMRRSIGPIYLAEDDSGPGCPYRREADPVNAELQAIDEASAFETAFAATRATIDALIAEQAALPSLVPGVWELNLDLKEVVEGMLAAVCRAWFGLPADGELVQGGGARWDWKVGDKVRFPGSFTPPSRYLFQPRPSTAVQRFGEDYGSALRTQFRELVRRHRAAAAAEAAAAASVAASAGAGASGAGGASAAAAAGAGAAAGASAGAAAGAGAAASGAGGAAAAAAAPGLDATAPVTAAILAAMSRRSDDAVGRTLLGVLMGFLPTTDGNLRQSLNEWLGDGSFWALRAAVLGALARGEPPVAAAEALRSRLTESMLLRPVPELIWRTATSHHELGGERIVEGDRIVVAIVSATHQALEEGDTDLAPIFGGDRGAGAGAGPAPTHACPAWRAAFGTMLGTLTALLGRPEAMRPGPAPLTLLLDGPQAPFDRPPAPPPPRTTPEPPAERHGDRVDAPATGQPAAPARRLIVDGDSWLCYWGDNLAEALVRRAGYRIAPADNLSVLQTKLGFFGGLLDPVGQPIAGPASQPPPPGVRLEALGERLRDTLRRRQPLDAVVLSLGLNDLTRRALLRLVGRNAPGSAGLVDAAVAEFVDRGMAAALTRCLAETVAACRRPSGDTVPIFVHGYDRPVPDGRPTVPRTPASLMPYLAVLGYADVADRVGLVGGLIDRVNAMQQAVCASTAFAGRVVYVDLRGTLCGDPADTGADTGANYRDDWATELHPTRRGFDKLADRLAAAIESRLGSPAAARTAEPSGGQTGSA